MAVVSKTPAQRLLERLDALSCPYTEGVDEDFIIELVCTPGEPRIRLLHWLFSKFGLARGELDSDTASIGSRTDSRLQRLLFVASSLGLCRSDDIDLIRGSESAATNIFNKQMKFMERLLDIVLIQDTADDSKSFIQERVISGTSPLKDQVNADVRLLEGLLSKQLLTTVLTPTVNLLPHDMRRSLRHNKDDTIGETPSFHKLTKQLSTVEKNLTRRIEILDELKEVDWDESGKRLQHVAQFLELVLSDLNQLVVSFTFTFENEMLPWCNKPQPRFTQLGPAFKRVHSLAKHFAQLLRGLHQIQHSYQQLGEGVDNKLKASDVTRAAIFAEVGQEAVRSFEECVGVLETSIQNEEPCQSLPPSLCTSMLQM